MVMSLWLIVFAAPAILASRLANKRANSRNFLRHAKALLKPLPQAVRLDAESHIEVVGPPTIQESVTVEIFFKPNKCDEVQGIWSQSYIILSHPLPLKHALESPTSNKPSPPYVHRLQDTDLAPSVEWWLQTQNAKLASNQTEGLPHYTKGIDIAVAAAIPTEHEGDEVQQAPFHGRGVMIDEQKQVVVWSRDIQGVWHGVVAGPCDETAWQHVALVQNGNTLLAYMDGKKSDMIRMNSNQGGRYLGYFSFGKFQNDTDSKHAFTGDMAEIRVWNRPRTEREIACMASEEAVSAMVNLAVHIVPSGKDEFEGREVANTASRWFVSRLTGKLGLADGPNFDRLESLREDYECPLEAMDGNKAMDDVLARKAEAKKLRKQYVRPAANQISRMPRGCPNECSGHGLCDVKSRECACFSSFVGKSCDTHNYMGYALHFAAGNFLTLPPMGGSFKSVTMQMWVSVRKFASKDSITPLLGVQAKPDQRQDLLAFKGDHLCLANPRSVPALACFEYVTFAPNKWVFVTVTYSVKRLGKEGTGSTTLYVNGEVKQVLPLTATAEVDITGPLVLGGGSFEGDVDELSVFSRATSPSEVQLMVGDRLIGTERGLLCYYRFDEGLGFSTKDLARSMVAFSALSSKQAPPEMIKVRQAQSEVNASVPDSTIAGRAFFALSLDGELGQKSSNYAEAPEWVPSGAPVTPCDPSCGAHGICITGKCQCLETWTGEGCATSRCPSACSGHGECLLFSEENQKFKLGGTMKDRLAAFGVDIDRLATDASKAVEAEAGKQVAHQLSSALGQSVSKSVAHQIPQLNQENGSLKHVLLPSLGGALHDALEHTHQYVCWCDDGFRPPSCVDKACAHSCGVHGVCGHNGTCVCNHGWTGEACDIKACSPSPSCSDRGQCVKGVCECFAGWSGDDCAERDVCPRDCSGHGQCGLHRVCKCDPLYTGVDCSWSAKCPNFCSGRGWCGDEGCNCKAPYTGKDCSELPCKDNCNGNGDCVHGRCVCKDGFSGATCGQTSHWPLRIRTTIKGDGSSTYSCNAGQEEDRAGVPVARSPYDINYPLKVAPGAKPSMLLSFEKALQDASKPKKKTKPDHDPYHDAAIYKKKWKRIVQSFAPETTTAPPATTTAPLAQEKDEYADEDKDESEGDNQSNDEI